MKHTCLTGVLGFIGMSLLSSTLHAAEPATQAVPTTQAATQPEVRRGVPQLGRADPRNQLQYFDRLTRMAEPTGTPTVARLPAYIELFKREFVDDARRFVFEVKAQQGGEAVELSGYVWLEEHRNALAMWIERMGLGPVKSSIVALPEAGVPPVARLTGDAFFYDVPAAVDGRRRETVTQNVAGDLVFPLSQPRNDHMLVMGSDGYIGWVAAEMLSPIGPSTLATALPPPDMAVVNLAIASAKSILGTPYVWGGTTGKGIDCSGLMQRSYRAAGINLPRDADQQSQVGRLTAVRHARAGLGAGDLLFFVGRRGSINHVGMYLGENQFIEAVDEGVKISSFNPADANYDAARDKGFVLAKRVTE